MTLQVPGPGGSAKVNGVSNITVPTLTVYRPAPGTSNGTAIIVAPGGGFEFLCIDSEGSMVAQWLAAHGVTAFVLKYRVHFYPVVPTRDARHHQEQFDAEIKSMLPERQIANSDGIQAVHYLRANAANLGIKGDRIGFMGFSAGAIITMGVILQSSPADRPNFGGPIYGVMDDVTPPKDAPPLFIAASQSDTDIPVYKSIDIFDKWTAADLPAELHIYEQGGHGFGAIQQGKPSDSWMQAFASWLSDHGWMSKSVAGVAQQGR